MTDQERIRFLEEALVKCYDVAIPQAMPWMGTLSAKAEYAAKTLAWHLRGLNRVLAHFSREIDSLKRFGYGDSIADKIETINRLLAEVQKAKAENPSTKCGYSLSVGSILNAYREGDISFDEAVGLLAMRQPTVPQPTFPPECPTRDCLRCPRCGCAREFAFKYCFACDPITTSEEFEALARDCGPKETPKP